MNLSLLSFLALALPTTSASTAEKLKSNCPHGSNGFIIVAKAGIDATSIATGNGVEITRAFKIIPGIVTGDLTDNQVAALIADPSVKSVEANCIIHLERPVSGANAPLRSWGLQAVGARDSSGAHLLPRDGTGANSYILDTGIRTTHEDLPNSEIAYDVFGGNGADGDGHGTHCSGTVGGVTSGVSPGTKLYGVKVLDDNGSGTWAGVIEGIDHVSDSGVGPRLMSMSLGGGVNDAVCDAVAAAEDAGVPVIAAAGNSNTDACSSTPANCATISVGSTTINDERSSFSNYGTCVHIFAPGSDITSSVSTSDTAYATYSGTSMACPHVAGVMAAVLEAYGTIEISALKAYIIDFAEEGRISNVGPDSPNLFLRGDLVPYVTSQPTISAAPTVSAAPTQGPTYMNNCEDPNSGETCLQLNLVTDNWGGETSWTLSETNGDILAEGSNYASDTEYDIVIGVPASQAETEEMAYTFLIMDSYGDGICCGWGEGSYELTAKDPAYAVVPAVSGGEFADQEATAFDVVCANTRRRPLFGGPPGC